MEKEKKNSGYYYSGLFVEDESVGDEVIGIRVVLFGCGRKLRLDRRAISSTDNEMGKKKVETESFEEKFLMSGDSMILKG